MNKTASMQLTAIVAASQERAKDERVATQARTPTISAWTSRIHSSRTRQRTIRSVEAISKDDVPPMIYH